jgi:hypothetical protein
MPTYQVPTDIAHKVKLESHLIYTLWMNKCAHAGQEAQMEVKTSLVGNGAKIKITCKNDSGKKLTKVEGVVFNNKFEGVVLIPDNVKSDEMVFFEAELPKHGLKGESNLIPVRPAIKVSKLQWDRTEAKRKDAVNLSCQFQNGVENGDDAVVLIYEHNPNSCNIKVVSIPTVIKDNKIEMMWEFDYQNDTAQIPSDNEMQKYNKNYANPQFYFVVVVDGVTVGEKRESGMLNFKDSIELKYTEFDGTPVPNAKYKVTLADGSVLEGKLSAEGSASLECFVAGKYTVEYTEDEQ